MTEMTPNTREKKPARERKPTHPLASAPRQSPASDAWKEFANHLVAALVGLEEDEYLILKVKDSHRYVQFMDQGRYGMRMESVSDYYLPEDDHLSEGDYDYLLKLGWHAPTQVPGTAGHDPDGSPNYYLDLAHPLPIPDMAVMAVLTLANVHNVGHPGGLEYDAQSTTGMSIRFPHLPIRRRAEEARA